MNTLARSMPNGLLHEAVSGTKKAPTGSWPTPGYLRNSAIRPLPGWTRGREVRCGEGTCRRSVVIKKRKTKSGGEIHIRYTPTYVCRSKTINNSKRVKYWSNAKKTTKQPTRQKYTPKIFPRAWKAFFCSGVWSAGVILSPSRDIAR